MLGWQSSLDDYLPRAGDEFVLVDVSDYHHFDPVVVLEQVVEVIDHHPGFENYWVQKLGSTADILPIGAAATLIFQRWEAAGLLPLISRKSAALLATAILDNTLNFTGQLTTQLDIRAYEVLARRAKLEADWPERYFPECQATIESDLTGALAVDMKRLKADRNLPQVFAQMAVWDASALRGAGQASCAVPASPQSTPASLVRCDAKLAAHRRRHTQSRKGATGTENSGVKIRLTRQLPCKTLVASVESVESAESVELYLKIK